MSEGVRIFQTQLFFTVFSSIIARLPMPPIWPLSSPLPTIGLVFPYEPTCTAFNVPLSFLCKMPTESTMIYWTHIFVSSKISLIMFTTLWMIWCQKVLFSHLFQLPQTPSLKSSEKRYGDLICNKKHKEKKASTRQD